MNKIAFTGSVLIAFCALQLVNSLTCYTCYSPQECKNAKLITCNEVAANETTRQLKLYHTYVSNVTSTNFKCLDLRYLWFDDNRKFFIYKYMKTYAKTKLIMPLNADNADNNVTLFGCVYPNVQPCTRSILPDLNTYNVKFCETCGTDMCNPAGKLSSSVYTIAATVVAVMLAKAFA
ncbi:maker456 [Drosophila busckii]|uniref:Maker456 n=1 Tax=Drosophila busckii TaxID=30019 RepID=A0A0M3QTK2_DROBS|nr:maker456 [Drosophila busckii]